MATEQDNTAPQPPQPDAAGPPVPANNPDYAPSAAPVTKGVPGGIASNQNQNPIHTNVTRDPASTPGYFRVLLAALPTRYLLRGTLSGFQDTTFHNIGLKGIPNWPESSARKMIDHVQAVVEGKKTSDDDVKLAKKILGSIGAKDVDAKLEDGINLFNELTGHERSQKEKAQRKVSLEHDLEKHISKVGSIDPNDYSALRASDKAQHQLEREIDRLHGEINVHATEAKSLQKEYSENYIKDLGKKARKRIIETKYDVGLGIGSTAVTTFYGWRVYTDIKNMFAEAVAYENGKQATEVGFRDLRKSDNVLVTESLKNLALKSVARYVGDSLFFTRFIAKLFPKMNALNSFGFGDIAVGLKGGQLIYDITNKKTTFFEDLLQLIDKKLNPIRGIGDPLSVSEVIDLYQKYAITHQPKLMFTDATIQQNKDGIDWEKSNKIFSHITDLMNATYKYKHTDVTPDAETPPADFALPKFLYLLGHNMINPYKPEETLAYVDIANRYGIEAVKQVHTAIGHGARLEDMLRKYPVDLSKLKETKAASSLAAMPVFFPANKDSMPEPANKPANKPDTRIAVVAAEREAMAPVGAPSITQG